MAYGRLTRQYKQARAHALVVAVIGWITVVAFAGLGPGNRSRFGPLKWSDFVHFYTLGHIARTRATSLLYDAPAQHELQAALVPESAADVFVPVYGPQTAVLFAPLSVLPYFAAGLVWAAVTVGVYVGSVWLAWRPSRDVLPDWRFVIVAALAFPPAWQLPTYGQTTAILLVAFAGAWLALEADRPVLAGMALSLIAIKPQFGLVLAPVAILCGEWRLVGGVLIGVVLQALAVLAVFDPGAFNAYAAAARGMPALAAVLEPDAYKMHSIRALTHLLPGRADLVVWAVLSVAVVAATARIWRQRKPWRLRFGVLVIASALVNPHLTIYDVTVIALPVIWIGGWLRAQHADTTAYWQVVYWIAVALLLPTAALLRVQLSTILIVGLFVLVVRTAGTVSYHECTEPSR